MIDERAIGERFRALAGELNERQRRVWAGAEALSHGWGGIAAVARATGMSHVTVAKGKREAEAGETIGDGRVRAPGGGRKASPRPILRCWPTSSGSSQTRPAATPSRRFCGRPRASAISPALCVSRATRSTSPRSPSTCARWTTACRPTARPRRAPPIPTATPSFATSTRRSRRRWSRVSRRFRWTPRRRNSSGTSRTAARSGARRAPRCRFRTHDFKDKELGKVNPYGVFDIASNEGWVSVGITADTAAFAIAAIGSWWQHLGSGRYPHATTLTITADCGGSNGNRTRLWKTELQQLANDTGLAIQVCHFPPGTSKWNKIEHRLFSFISRNWRGQPLVSRQAIVSLIGATTSTAGLKVYAQLDESTYERAIQVTDAELAAVNLTRDQFHGE